MEIQKDNLLTFLNNISHEIEEGRVIRAHALLENLTKQVSSIGSVNRTEKILGKDADAQVSKEAKGKEVQERPDDTKVGKK